MSSAYEYWYKHSTDLYYVEVYIARDCDEVAISKGELQPGKITDFQMVFEKKFRGEVIKEFYSDNALVAGEWVRDEIGFGPAKDMLNEMDIPTDCLVCKLGEKG